jgi:hypothetical protein
MLSRLVEVLHQDENFNTPLPPTAGYDPARLLFSPPRDVTHPVVQPPHVLAIAISSAVALGPAWEVPGKPAIRHGISYSVVRLGGTGKAESVIQSAQNSVRMARRSLVP